MRIAKYFSYQVIAFLLVMFVVSACKKNDATQNNYNADKTALTALIDSINAVNAAAAEGNKPGQYAPGSKALLAAAIDLATQVKTGNSFTQQQVNNSIANLRRTIQQFSSMLIQEVSVANLVAHWKFNGNAIDSSGNGHDGVAKSGTIGPSTAPVDGGVLPKLIADRFNRPNMAYSFDNGAYIEVPYSQALNPKDFSICIWINPTVTYSDNYILSLNRWNGFKFQLQSNDFPFLTFHDTNNGYHDVDDNPGAVPHNTWTYVAVTYTNGTMKFYINNQLVKTAAITGTPATLTSPVPLAIGQQLPKTFYNSAANGDYDYYGPAYFHGAMDDLRFYNKALSDAEILSIYTIEKTL